MRVEVEVVTEQSWMALHGGEKVIRGDALRLDDFQGDGIASGDPLVGGLCLTGLHGSAECLSRREVRELMEAVSVATWSEWNPMKSAG
jgi:hypothetical protein